MTTLLNILNEQQISTDSVPAALCVNPGPVFNEPWELQAFSITVSLMDEGYFTRAEWADTLTQAIRAAQAAGDPDLGNTYYSHWVNALETICVEKGLTVQDEMDQRKADWRQAYLNTPHGTPIVLEAAHPTVDHDHVHDHDHHAHEHACPAAETPQSLT